MLLRSRDILVARDPRPSPVRVPIRRRGYGVDVPAMSLYVHGWDIHALCFATSGARVTKVGLYPAVPQQRPHAAGADRRERVAGSGSPGMGERIAGSERGARGGGNAERSG